MVERHHNLTARLLDANLAQGRGDEVALCEGDRTWTYRELTDQVARMGGALVKLGVGRGERVAVLMRDTLEAAATILGVLRIGAVAVPLSELARPDDLRESLGHAGAVVAIVDGELEPALDAIRGHLPALRDVLCFHPRAAGERDIRALCAAAKPAAAVAVATTDEALLLYSAGFADDAFGVRHDHASPLAAYESFAVSYLGLVPGQRVFAVARMSTAFGLGAGLLFPLLAGARSLLLPAQPHSRALLAAIAAFAPDYFLATPSIYGQLARDVAAAAAPPPLAQVRRAIAGGEGMPDKLVPRIRAALGVAVEVGYGITEVLQIALAGIVADDDRSGACGRPLAGIEARVVDDDGRTVGPDEIGTLQVRAPSMCAGYWTGLATPAVDVDGWLTTRDRFLVDGRGVFHHCGRTDDLFKVGGKWVAPAEVERALISHDAVWEAAVVGVGDEDGLIKPLAFVVVNVGHTATPELETELREFVKQTLAPYKYPRWIEFIDALPRGPGGRLLRYKLRPTRRRRRAETGVA
ncbi:MAG: benzoate-CoA ligase family protein [Myxococcales bacterium]|nr:benzoate-CoA ligase family protein [Myxococcales bacterium]